MKKRNLTRYGSLALVLVLVLGLLLLSGCAVTNPATKNLTEEGLVNIDNLSTEVKLQATDYIKLPFAYLLEWLYEFTQSYGLALILFALIVKIILLPTSALSKKGMMKMSRLTPQVKALEAKYGDDKQKYQEEVNKLYKTEGAGGCAGCLWSFLPLLLLLPLYYIIREPITWLMFHGNVSQATLGQIQNVFITASKNAAEGSALAKLDVTGFYWQMQALPFIDQLKAELSAISPNIVSMNTRFMGIELATVPQFLFWKNFDTGVWNAVGQFLLPVFSGGINWISMWISQKLNNTVIVDEKGRKDETMAKANDSTKTMTMLMPLMSIYIGFVAPAGLSIYWIIQGVFSVVQDYFLTKHYRKVYDAEDAVKQAKAAEEAAREAERERVRAEKRAENPDGIVANTSKKKLQQKQRTEQAAKEAAYLAQKAEQDPTKELPSPQDLDRPYRRGRNYRADRYSKAGNESNNEE